MLSGGLAGRALPGFCLHVGSRTELSESFLQAKGSPVSFHVADLCSLPIHVVWGIALGRVNMRTGQML